MLRWQRSVAPEDVHSGKQLTTAIKNRIPAAQRALWAKVKAAKKAA